MTTQLQTQESVPLAQRINIRGDLKVFLAAAVKDVIRNEIRAGLAAKGFSNVTIDTADALKAYITVTTPLAKDDHTTVERTFVISLKEMST